MAGPRFPIERYLVPAQLQPPGGEGFTVVESAIRAGLPHAIPLGGNQRLLLVLPTGLARAWREAVPETVVSSSLPETVAGPGPAALPLRLLLQRGGSTLAAVPVVAGLQIFVEEAGEGSRVRIEVAVISWTLHAGSVVGPGDFGSRIALSWRRVGEAATQFSTPPPNPHLVPRLPPEEKTESETGRRRKRRGRLRYDVAITYLPKERARHWRIVP